MSEPHNRSSAPDTAPAGSAASADSRRPPAWVIIVGALVAAVLAVGIIVGVTGTGFGSGVKNPPPVIGTPVASPPVTDPAEALPVRDPVKPDAPVEIVPGVTVSLSPFEAVDGEAKVPGEIAGPSIRFTVTIDNRSKETADLTQAVVSAAYGDDQTPALPLTEPGSKPFPASVGAGEKATGTFVFTVPKDQRGVVTVTVDYLAGVPAAVFTGSAEG